MVACDAGSARLCDDLHCKVFSHKLAAWRSGSSSLSTNVPEGWASSPSRWALERRQLDEAASVGMKLDRPSGYSSTAKPRSF